MQKLFSSEQIKAWDAYTIQHEPISSLALMERASGAFVQWFIQNYKLSTPIYVFCGPGNNGGDGFAICRILQQKDYNATPYLVDSQNSLSPDCQINYQKLNLVQHIQNSHIIKNLSFTNDTVVIDALFGSGLSRPISGIYHELINYLNTTNTTKIAIDIPSGMFCDTIHNKASTVFKSDFTISFQTPKRAFFLPEYKYYIKESIILDIGLHNDYYQTTSTNWFLCSSNSDTLPIANRTLTQLPELANSIEKVAYLIQLAKEQQQTICYKKEMTCLVTPKEKIYLIVK